MQQHPPVAPDSVTELTLPAPPKVNDVLKPIELPTDPTATELPTALAQSDFAESTI